MARSRKAPTNTTKLNADLAKARRWTGSAEATADAVKAEYKRSRNAYRKARKIAKEAWKQVKALKKRLKAEAAKKRPAKKSAGADKKKVRKVKAVRPIKDSRK